MRNKEMVRQINLGLTALDDEAATYESLALPVPIIIQEGIAALRTAIAALAPEPLAVVEGYIRREHMMTIRRAGIGPWLLTIPIQRSKEGIAVRVTITPRKVESHDA